MSTTIKAIRNTLTSGRWLSMVTLGLALSACNLDDIKSIFIKKKDTEYPTVDARRFADAVYFMALSSRNAYAKNVVTPLAIQRTVIAASENWKEEHVLPLPAQFIRYTAELYGDNSAGVTLQLQSLWPINPSNKPTSQIVIDGLDAVNKNPEAPYYATEKVGDQEFFTAVYADRASAVSCIICHNEHPNSPRHDFSGKDVLGGFVVRLALANPKTN